VRWLDVWGVRCAGERGWVDSGTLLDGFDGFGDNLECEFGVVVTQLVGSTWRERKTLVSNMLKLVTG
jgi:hypothetical protein